MLVGVRDPAIVLFFEGILRRFPQLRRDFHKVPDHARRAVVELAAIRGSGLAALDGSAAGAARANSVSREDRWANLDGAEPDAGGVFYRWNKQTISRSICRLRRKRQR
jgi:hypothetical protein